MSKINDLISALQSFQEKVVTVSQESSLTFFKTFTDFKFYDDLNALVFIDLRTDEEMKININAIEEICIDIDNDFISLKLDKGLKVEIIMKEEVR